MGEKHGQPSEESFAKKAAKFGGKALLAGALAVGAFQGADKMDKIQKEKAEHQVGDIEEFKQLVLRQSTSEMPGIVMRTQINEIKARHTDKMLPTMAVELINENYDFLMTKINDDPSLTPEKKAELIAFVQVNFCAPILKQLTPEDLEYIRKMGLSIKFLSRN